MNTPDIKTDTFGNRYKPAITKRKIVYQEGIVPIATPCYVQFEIKKESGGKTYFEPVPNWASHRNCLDLPINFLWRTEFIFLEELANI